MSAAQASSLLGDVISGSFAYPCVTCTYTGQFSYFFNPFIVLAGPAETTLFLGNPTFYSAWNVNFEANSVTLTMAPHFQTLVTRLTHSTDQCLRYCPAILLVQ